MSHFLVLVFGQDVEKQLQPYHEYECTGIEDEYVKFVPAEETQEELEKKYEEGKETYDYKSFEEFMEDYYGYKKNEEGVYGRVTNPNAKWDWWVVGGRWTGFLKAKTNVVYELGSPGVFGTPAPENGADVILKGGVNWEEMMREAGETAEKKYDLVHKAIEGTPSLITWDEMREMHGDDNIDKARSEYHKQPCIIALKELSEKHEDLFGFFVQLEDYLCPREEYIERRKRSAITPYAFVRDGKWYQKGKMGWWGMSSDEMTQDEWNKQFWEMLQTIPDEEIVTVVDCHI